MTAASTIDRPSPMIDIISFGCRLNHLESEVARTRAAEAGLTDAVVINSCAVTGEAVRDARQAVRRAWRENSRRPVVVTGCVAQIEPERFAAMPEVALVLGNEEKLRAESYAGLAGSPLGVEAPAPSPQRGDGWDEGVPRSSGLNFPSLFSAPWPG